jgi:histidine triad (HIT) family protein
MSDCLFCRIVAGEIPADKVLETEELIAFRDIDPKAPVHLLVIPKRHIESLGLAGDADAGILGKILTACRDLAEKEGIAEEGYRVVNNCGRDGGQAVFHIHFHLLGGRAMAWPPG